MLTGTAVPGTAVAGTARGRPFSHNRIHGLVGTEQSERESTGHVMTADPRSTCGRIRRGEGETGALSEYPILNSPGKRLWGSGTLSGAGHLGGAVTRPTD